MIKNNYCKIKSIKQLFISVLLIISTCALSGCESFHVSTAEPITRQGLYFDTLISVSIYDDNNLQILDECFDLCDVYEHMFSPEISGSDIYAINSHSTDSITVSSETTKLLRDASAYSDLTEGMFDITVYTVSALWDFHHQDGNIPDEKDVLRNLSHVGYDKINIVDDNTVALSDPKVKLELGGIAKGYIADMIAAHLEKNNIKSAIVNIGGDIRLVGCKPDNTPFTIGIKDPDGTDSVMAAIKAENLAVATSGTYERFIEYDGKKYHHILNPHSGYPVESDVSSVTVVTDSSEKADALCTCVILMGSTKGIELIESQENTEALMKLTDGSIIKSSGINKYLMSSQ